MTVTARAGILAAAALLGAARPALAEVNRYALVLSSNKGRADERDLLYAESDASRVVDTLARLGGFPRNRIVHLAAPTADEARDAIVDLNLAIQRDLRAAAGGEALLFVYYSGHGDARSLHLGPTDLSMAEFSKLIRLSEAKLKMFLVDACRSGALTRVKGGHQVAPFRIDSEDRLHNEGYAIITSSAAGEEAQESDTLRSSLFTHFFLSALRGAADTNQDRRITLGEAYAYAYEQTLKASMATVVGFQHATFDFDLRGRFDPVLTDLRSVGDQAQITFTAPGDYLVMRADTESILLEANTKVAPLPVLVPAADYAYRVRMRGRASMYETEVRLRSGESRAIGPENMRQIAFAQVVRKGGTAAQLAQGPALAGLVHGPLRDGFGPMFGAQVSYSLELPRVSLMPRIGFQGGGSHNLGPDVISNRLREITIELAALHVVDIGGISLAPLASAGIGLLEQTVLRQDPCPAAGCRFTSNPIAAIFSIGTFASYALPRGFTIEAALELSNFIARHQDATDTLISWKNAKLQGIVTYRASLGMGYRF